jgi:hypothetical protein
VQLLALEFGTDPASHGVQKVFPVLLAIVPAPQSVHWEAWSAAEKEPEGQEVHWWFLPPINSRQSPLDWKNKVEVLTRTEGSRGAGHTAFGGATIRLSKTWLTADARNGDGGSGHQTKNYGYQDETHGEVSVGS